MGRVEKAQENCATYSRAEVRIFSESFLLPDNVTPQTLWEILVATPQASRLHIPHGPRLFRAYHPGKFL